MLCKRLRWVIRDDRPRMTFKRRGQSTEPLHSEVSFAQFEVADLLARSPHPRRQSDEGEALSLSKLLKPITQFARRRGSNHPRRVPAL